MLQNPFLIPPQVESPQSRSCVLGFAFGLQGPDFTDFDFEITNTRIGVIELVDLPLLSGVRALCGEV